MWYKEQHYLWENHEWDNVNRRDNKYVHDIMFHGKLK